MELGDFGLDGVVDGAQVFLKVLPLEGKVGNFGSVGLEEVEGFAEVWHHLKVLGDFIYGGRHQRWQVLLQLKKEANCNLVL